MHTNASAHRWLGGLSDFVIADLLHHQIQDGDWVLLMMSWPVASSLYFPVRGGSFMQRWSAALGGGLNLRRHQRRG